VTRIKLSDKKQYLLLVIIVLLSRLPFLFNGFGLDGDSWSVAITAKYFHDTGIYQASRLPGFPVHEFLCSALIGFGAFGLNMLSAVFSALAVLFFALILRTLRFRFAFFAALTFSLVPVFFIYSTTTIDYVIAIAFVLGGMYFLLKNKLILSGILLGFSIGTRITSGAMLLSLSILLIENDGFKNNFRRISLFILPALITGILLYIPLLNIYGKDFFTYYNVPYPSIAKVLYKFSFEVWGVLGFLGLMISTGLLFLPNRITAKKFLFPRSVNEKFVVSWLITIDLYTIAYLKLPMESGYLIPIIPFVILVFGKYLYEKAFIFFCCMLIASSMLCTISPVERFDAVTPSKLSFQFNAAGEKLTFDLLQGPVVSYNGRRKNGMSFVNGLLSSTDTLSVKSVIVAGRWYNQMFVQCGDTSKLKVKLCSYLKEEEAVYFYAKGYVIYYLPKQDYYNKVMKNVDLEIYKAIPYLKDDFVFKF
jgi:hypothetical protein